VFETCTIAGWVADLCAELGLVFSVADRMHEAWSGRKARPGPGERPCERWHGQVTDRDRVDRITVRSAAGNAPVNSQLRRSGAGPVRGRGSGRPNE
jgi:hypothetical protein